MSIRAEAERVSKQYGRHVALADVSLAVSAGEVVGLVGPNGAGKTTLLRILAGLMRADIGRVSIGPPAAIVRYFAGEYTLPPAVPTRSWLRLWTADTRPDWPRKRLGALSRGTRQRVGLEAVLAEPHPALLLLDEPWEGLDPDASRWLSTRLDDRRVAGAAVVVSSHRIHDLAHVCDRCVFLVGGRLSTETLVSADLEAAADRSALIFAAFDRARGRR